MSSRLPPHPWTCSPAAKFSEFPDPDPAYLGPLQACFPEGHPLHASHAHDTAVWRTAKGSKTSTIALVTCDDGNRYWAAKTGSGWRFDHRHLSL